MEWEWIFICVILIVWVALSWIGIGGSSGDSNDGGFGCGE